MEAHKPAVWALAGLFQWDGTGMVLSGEGGWWEERRRDGGCSGDGSEGGVRAGRGITFCVGYQ